MIKGQGKPQSETKRAFLGMGGGPENISEKASVTLVSKINVMNMVSGSKTERKLKRKICKE